jgi:hypothetical protein
MGWANSQMFCMRGTYIPHLDVHERDAVRPCPYIRRLQHGKLVYEKLNRFDAGNRVKVPRESARTIKNRTRPCAWSCAIFYWRLAQPGPLYFKV